MPLQYDPEFANLAKPLLQSLAQTTRPAVHDIATRRANLTAFTTQKSHSAQILNNIEKIIHFAQAADKHDVPILHFRKKKEEQDRGPAMVHMHGGWFIVLSAAIGIPSLSGLVSETGVQILSVDYRLAPENPFPVPLDDCWTALN